MGELDDAIENIANVAPNTGQSLRAELNKFAASVTPRIPAREMLYGILVLGETRHDYVDFKGPAESVMYAVMRRAFASATVPVLFGEDKGRGPTIALHLRDRNLGTVIGEIERKVPTIRAVVTWTDDNRLSFAVGELVM